MASWQASQGNIARVDHIHFPRRNYEFSILKMFLSLWAWKAKLARLVTSIVALLPWPSS